jgi:hypothetical protein
MKKKLFMGSIVIAVLMGIIGNVSASPMNESFENGLNGWYSSSLAGGVDVVTTTTAFDGNKYFATDGDYFAMLSGTTLLWTDIVWSAGDTISFDWAFLSGDSKGHNDFSIAVLVNANSWDFNSELLSDTVAIGTHGDTGWRSYSFDTSSVNGGGFIGFAVIDNGGTLGTYLHPSSLLIDNMQITEAPLPEPATLLLFATGLLGLVGVGAKNRKLT